MAPGVGSIPAACLVQIALLHRPCQLLLTLLQICISESRLYFYPTFHPGYGCSARDFRSCPLLKAWSRRKPKSKQWVAVHRPRDLPLINRTSTDMRQGPGPGMRTSGLRAPVPPIPSSPGAGFPSPTLSAGQVVLRSTPFPKENRLFPTCRLLRGAHGLGGTIDTSFLQSGDMALTLSLPTAVSPVLRFLGEYKYINQTRQHPSLARLARHGYRYPAGIFDSRENIDSGYTCCSPAFDT